MKKLIVAYLCLTLLIGAVLLTANSIWMMPAWWIAHAITIACAAMGLIGGSLYCLRGVYLNICVFDRWDSKWHIWYFIRPCASLVSGFLSYIFLKAGLLVLEAASKPEAVPYGYLAIAFIAGYNVDNFLKKLEEVASTVWGINKSRSADERKSESGTGGE